MNIKIIGALGIIVLLVVAYFVLAPNPAAAPAQPLGIEQPTDTTSTSMRAEENMVVVMEQKPGNSIRGMVHLAAPGYLVIHEDDNGEPGAIIGSSSLLPAGDTDGIIVPLSRATKDGEILHAMLHFEKGANARFTAAEDTPVPSALGGPISGWFHIADDAPDVTPVTL